MGVPVGSAYAVVPPLVLKWRRDVGNSVTAPLRLADGLLFVGTGDGKLKVLDAATGHKCGELLVRGAAVRAAPGAAAAHLIVVWSNAGESVRGVDRRTGVQMWSHDVGDCSATPVVARGYAVVVGESGQVLAVDLATGEQVWRATVGGQVRSAVAGAGGVVIVGDGSALRAFALEGGDPKWRIELGAAVSSRIAVRGDAAFVATVAGELWSVEIGTGARRWGVRVAEAAIRSGPVVIGSRVIIGADDRRVVTLDAATGNVMWDAGTGGVVRGAPAADGDVVYVAAGDGSLIALALDDGRRLWETRLSAPALTDLALGHGGLFAGADDGNVYCFGVGAGVP